jgi:hypothetical protein
MIQMRCRTKKKNELWGYLDARERKIDTTTSPFYFTLPLWPQIGATDLNVILGEGGGTVKEEDDTWERAR